MCDDVISTYTLAQALEDGVLVAVFKHRWPELSGGKPIVATRPLFEALTPAALQGLWNEYARWLRSIRDTLPEEDQLFSTAMDGKTVWVLEDGAAHTIMYPQDY